MNIKRTYIRSSLAYYAKSANLQVPTVNVNIEGFNGELQGEIEFEWVELGGKWCPRLKVFDDGWAVLSQCKDLLERLEKLNDQSIQEPEFCKMLDELRFTDATEYKDPYVNETKASKEFVHFLRASMTETGDERTALRDIITDVIHVCDEQGYDFNQLIKGAGEVANEENGEPTGMQEG